MKRVICYYCGQPAEYVDSAAVYNGRSLGMIYYCRPCNAYVGVHKGTDQPLGRLANANLRFWKKKAHAAFDPLWQSGRMTRSRAYTWLSNRMGLPIQKTHIGMFDVAQCKQVVSIIQNEGRKNHASNHY
jgi:hypothetical protein